MKQSLGFILGLGFGILGVSAAGASVAVPGSITANTVWTAAQGPYLVQGTMVVERGAVLTLEPGTQVQFQSASAGQPVPGRLVVRGGLSAVGASGHPVVFVPAAAGGLWGGLYFDHSDPAHSLLEDCVLSGGGVAVNESSPTILRCVISHCRIAVQVGAHSAPLVVADNLSHNTYGICLQSPTADPVVRRNQVYDNDYGVYLQDFGSPRFSANTILRNRRYNLVDASAKPIRMAGNDFGPENPAEARRTIYDGSRDSRLGRVDLGDGSGGAESAWTGPRLSFVLTGLFAQKINGSTAPSVTGLGNNLRVECLVRPSIAYGLSLGYDAFTGNGRVLYATNLDAIGKLIPIRSGGLGCYMLGGVGLNLMALQPALQGHYHALAGLGLQYAMDSTWGMDLSAVYNFYTPIAVPLQTVNIHFGVSYGFGL